MGNALIPGQAYALYLRAITGRGLENLQNGLGTATGQNNRCFAVFSAIMIGKRNTQCVSHYDL